MPQNSEELKMMIEYDGASIRKKNRFQKNQKIPFKILQKIFD